MQHLGYTSWALQTIDDWDSSSASSPDFGETESRATSLPQATFGMFGMAISIDWRKTFQGKPCIFDGEVVSYRFPVKIVP